MSLARSRVADYELLERIGTGGMAEVFIAKTTGAMGLERLVAIKRILPTMVGDEEFVTMLVDEATLVSKLNHPAIAQVYDLGRNEDEVFLAMEYVAGRDLGTIVRRLRKDGQLFDRRLACHVIALVADALGHAHAAKDAKGQSLKLVHRDVSPGNVMITYDGDVKLIDFGIAHARNRHTKTQVGVLKGKVRYMSPEQVTGKGLDGRSDVYAAGVVLWELLAGKRIFDEASDASILRNIALGKLAPLHEVAPDVPEELSSIVARALEKRPAQRYERAEDFASALQRFLTHSVDPIRPRDALSRLMGELFEAEKQADRKLRNALSQPDPSRLREVSVSKTSPMPREVSVSKPPPPKVPEPEAPAVRVKAPESRSKNPVVPRKPVHDQDADTMPNARAALPPEPAPAPKPPPPPPITIPPEASPAPAPKPPRPPPPSFATVPSVVIGPGASEDVTDKEGRAVGRDDTTPHYGRKAPEKGLLESESEDGPTRTKLTVEMYQEDRTKMVRPPPLPPSKWPLRLVAIALVVVLGAVAYTRLEGPSQMPEPARAPEVVATREAPDEEPLEPFQEPMPVMAPEPARAPAPRPRPKPPVVIAAPAPAPEPSPVIVVPLPKPEPSAIPTGPGLLRVSAWPPGRVFIDDVPTDRLTPLVDFSLPAGPHRIRVVADDGRIGEAVAHIRPEETSAITVPYPPPRVRATP